MYTAEIKRVIVCVPIHGWSIHSLKLAGMLARANQKFPIELWVSNSDTETKNLHPKFLVRGENSISIHESSIPANAFWSSNVSSILREVSRDFDQTGDLSKPSLIVVMNHDCQINEENFQVLVETFPSGSREVWHPVVLYPGRKRVWWGGTKYRWDLKEERPWHGCHPDELPTGKWETDSMPAQCLIFDGQLLKDLRFEHIARKVPHYKGDPCLSAALRWAGGKLYAVREPTVQVSLDDLGKKRQFMYPRTLSDVKRCLTHPLSYRNLGGTFWGCRYERRWALTGYMTAIYYTAGKLAKTLLEWVEWKVARKAE
jgi:hypothetical protein